MAEQVEYVWVLTEAFDYEGEQVLSVHRTLESARSAALVAWRDQRPEGAEVEPNFVRLTEPSGNSCTWELDIGLTVEGQLRAWRGGHTYSIHHCEVKQDG